MTVRPCKERQRTFDALEARAATQDAAGREAVAVRIRQRLALLRDRARASV
jgi:hypothetical protein